MNFYIKTVLVGCLFSLTMLDGSLLKTDDIILYASPIGDGGQSLQCVPNRKIPYTTKQFHNYIDQLTTNPVELLRKNADTPYILQAYISQQTDQKKETVIQGFNDVCTKITTHNPIGFIYECIGYCNLQRFSSPERRAHLEKEVLAYVMATFPNKQECITITSLGSGHLFQELVIFALLYKAGYCNIRFNLIDKIYAPFLKKITDEKGKIRAIPTLSQLITNPQADEDDLDSMRDPIDLIMQTFNFYQFCSFLQQNNNASINIFANVDDYLVACNSNEDFKSDITLGVDFNVGNDCEKCLLTLDFLKLNILGLKFDRAALLLNDSCQKFLRTEKKITPEDSEELKKAFIFDEKGVALLEKWMNEWCTQFLKAL